MSKHDIRPTFERQRRILNIKIGIEIIMNVKIRYSASVRMSKKAF